MTDFVERLKNEPVLISALVIALGNIFGHDLTPLEGTIQTLVVGLIGWIVRQRVTPTSKLT